MLAQRVASAVVGVPVIFVLILIGGDVYVAFAAAALAVAALEFQHPHLGWLHHLSLLAAAFSAALAGGAHVGLNWVLWFLAGATLITLAASLVRFRADTMLADWLWTVGCIIYVGFLGSFIVLLRDFDNGRDWVYLALFSTFAVDTSAYFTGRTFGRHKLAPAISPKKTVEGAAGGFVAGALFVPVAGQWWLPEVPSGFLAALGAALVAMGIAGDLFESMLKRSAGVKDSSGLIPGHGGVLDRIDALLFAAPVYYVVLKVL